MTPIERLKMYTLRAHVAFVGAYSYNRALIKAYIYWISFFILLEVVLCIVSSVLLADVCDSFVLGTSFTECVIAEFIAIVLCVRSLEEQL